MEKTCKIYKIIDNTNGDCYIGSTTQALKERLSKHKCACNYVKKCTSYKIINNGNYKIELIEDLGNVSKEERYTKERYYIENINCINKSIPGRTMKESLKAYREKKLTCDCGSIFRNGDKVRHERSKKHIDYLNTK